MRRLDHGPDVKVIFRKALEEAAGNVGAAVEIAPGAVHLELPEASASSVAAATSSSRL